LSLLETVKKVAKKSSEILERRREQARIREESKTQNGDEVVQDPQSCNQNKNDVLFFFRKKKDCLPGDGDVTLGSM